MSEIDDKKPQRGRPRGRQPKYAADLDKLVITVCGGLIRRPDERPGTALDSPKERQQWWKAFHWWYKYDPKTLRARLRPPEIYRARPSLMGVFGSEYGPLPSELVFYLLKTGIVRDEPLIRDTIAYWQRLAVVSDEAKNWLRRIDPELIPPEVRGPGQFGVEPYLPWAYEGNENWIASFVALYGDFPGPDLRSFVQAVHSFVSVNSEHPSEVDRFKMKHRQKLMTLKADLYETFCERTPAPDDNLQGMLSSVRFSDDESHKAPDEGAKLCSAEDAIVEFLQQFLETYTRIASGKRVVNKAAIRRLVAEKADVTEGTVRHAIMQYDTYRDFVANMVELLGAFPESDPRCLFRTVVEWDVVDRERPSRLGHFKVKHRRELMGLKAHLYKTFCEEGAPEDDEETDEKAALYSAEDAIVDFLRRCLDFTRIASGERVVNKAAIRRFVAETVRDARKNTMRSRDENP